MSAISFKLDVTPANTNRLLYAVPAGKVATVNLNLCNRDATQTRLVNVSITDDTPHSVADFIEYNASIPPRGVLERTGLVLKSGDSLFVTSPDGVTVSARLSGFEENA